MSEKKRAWVCKTAFEYEVEGDTKGTTFYPTPDSLRAARRCCESGSCTLVEVEMRVVGSIKGTDL